MIENATGIILRTRPLTETSVIVQWLTPELGRVATVARGARRLKSPFVGKLDLFYAADFSFSRSRHSELHLLREVSLGETHRVLREDMLKLRQATYAARFIEQATEIETPLRAVYELMRGYLDSLCHRPSGPQTVFAFELKLLRELGLNPDLGQTALTAGARQMARALLAKTWSESGCLRPTRRQIAELGQFLHGFVIFHLGRLPPGRAAVVAGDVVYFQDKPPQKMV
jgi:DNA repair protein RecO (recombination protein O)